MKDLQVDDRIIGVNGAKYKIISIDGEYLVVELIDKERDLPELWRIKRSEIKNYTEGTWEQMKEENIHPHNPGPFKI